MKLEDRMTRSIKLRTSIVVLRSDFTSMGSDSQVGRVLARFVENGILVRVSKGAFAKARINQYTGKPTPAGTLEMIAAELFRKLKISIAPSTLVAEYNSGKSTQIPMGTVVNTGNRRISRKVIVGNNTVVYENSSRAAAV
ncbi:DUF6088 family protein [Pseudomonas simiae]|jgi:hypothetical protein|uniref:S-adenosylhomocysteine hydrolase n=1 Tax=Pseudomonas simiae TaxID=321846 RepID=A0A1N7U752_9PSED|nr:DUF6088 family protein [Pseudomonas simiae]AIB37882.1 S-adenosylhomocysteine hydrolase [Pseudomonas simiae]